MRRDAGRRRPRPAPALPDDVRVLPFRPGRDEAAWLRVNARAFATTPSRAAGPRRTCALREAEPWFDPAGFLLAWRGDPTTAAAARLRTGPRCTRRATSADEPVGEVYVLGVDPDAQGLRLGRALTDLGLAHLRGRGLGAGAALRRGGQRRRRSGSTRAAASPGSPSTSPGAGRRPRA